MIRRVAMATVLQIFSLAIGLADRIVVTALLLRFWGVSVFEDWSVLFAAASLFSLLDLGLHMTFSNSFTQARQRGEVALYKRRVSTALFINAVLLFLGAVVLAVIVLNSHLRSLVLVTRLTDGHIVLLFLSSAVLLQTISSISTAIYRANGHFVRGLAVDGCFLGLRTLLVAIVVIAGYGPVAAAGVFLAVTAFYTLVVLPWDQAFNLRAVRYAPVLPDLAELAAISSQASLFCVQQFANVLLTAAPLIILSRLSDSVGQIAVFLLLRTLFNSIRQVITALSNAVSIELAQLHAAFGGVRVARQLLRYTRIVSLLSSAALGVLLGLGDPFFVAWSGGTLRMDFHMALIFAFGFLVSGPFIVANNYLNYIGEAKVGAISRIVNMLVALLLSLALGPLLGVLGIVTGLAAGEAVGLGLIYLRSTARWTGLSLPVLLAQLTAFNLAGLLPVVAVATLVAPVNAASPLGTLALRALLLAPVAVAVVLGFGLSRLDLGIAWRTTLQLVKRRMKR